MLVELENELCSHDCSTVEVKDEQYSCRKYSYAFCPKMLTACSLSRLFADSQCLYILIKDSRVSQFLSSVLIRFIEENARSHSAVLTGISAPILGSLIVLETYVTQGWISAQRVDDMMH